MHRFGRICISFDYFLLFLDEEENVFESEVFHRCIGVGCVCCRKRNGEILSEFLLFGE